MKARDAMSLDAITGSRYPEPFRSRVLPREKRILGDLFGLTRIGVNLTVLYPGAESSMRHWHRRADELIYVLDGEIVLCTDTGEETLQAGMVVGFKAGDPDAHQFVNRSERTVSYLEISNRDIADVAEYPDVDLAYSAELESRNPFTHKDGTPY